MNYDFDAKIEETAHEVAADPGFTLDDLRDLHLYASNKHSARVFARAVELRETATEELCPNMTSRSS